MGTYGSSEVVAPPKEKPRKSRGYCFSCTENYDYEVSDADTSLKDAKFYRNRLGRLGEGGASETTVERFDLDPAKVQEVKHIHNVINFKNQILAQFEGYGDETEWTDGLDGPVFKNVHESFAQLFKFITDHCQSGVDWITFNRLDFTKDFGYKHSELDKRFFNLLNKTEIIDVTFDAGTSEFVMPSRVMVSLFSNLKKVRFLRFINVRIDYDTSNNSKDEEREPMLENWVYLEFRHGFGFYQDLSIFLTDWLGYELDRKRLKSLEKIQLSNSDRYEDVMKDKDILSFIQNEHFPR